MPHAAAALLVVLSVLLADCAVVPAQGVLQEAYVEPIRPTVIAFLPPSMRDPANVDAAAARAQVEAAVGAAKVCLGEDFASYRMLFADRIVVRSPGREESFELAHFAPMVGALLLRPGSNARILFAGGGPEALERMLRSAVSEYFGKKCDG